MGDKKELRKRGWHVLKNIGRVLVEFQDEKNMKDAIFDAICLSLGELGILQDCDENGEKIPREMKSEFHSQNAIRLAQYIVGKRNYIYNISEYSYDDEDDMDDDATFRLTEWGCLSAAMLEHGIDPDKIADNDTWLLIVDDFLELMRKSGYMQGVAYVN